MTGEPKHAPWPDDVVVSVAGGVRVFSIAADRMQASPTGSPSSWDEHMHDGDELHLTYNPMQSGGRNTAHQGQSRRKPQPGWTEPRFEYCARVALREPATPPRVT